MILFTQLAVIVVAILVLYLGLTGRRTHFGQAWKKIGVLLLAVAMVIAVLLPNLTNRLAHLVGVGRGADLLLYALALAFILSALTNYLNTQDEKETLHKLARKIALLEAEDRYKGRMHD